VKRKLKAKSVLKFTSETGLLRRKHIKIYQAQEMRFLKQFSGLSL
jgi:hypothetical protein